MANSESTAHQEITIDDARKNICNEAIYEMEELAEMIASTDVTDGNSFAIRGIARRIGQLTYVMARAMDDKSHGATKELELELLGITGANKLWAQRAEAS